MTGITTNVCHKRSVRGLPLNWYEVGLLEQVFWTFVHGQISYPHRATMVLHLPLHFGMKK